MANRFWVGNGAATWTTSGAGSGWATTSGGANGQAVPTAADDVFLDATSPALTIAAASVCRSLNCTGYTNTLTHNATFTLTIGDGTAGASNVALLFVSGMTYTKGNATSSALDFASTSGTVQTITWATKVPGAITFSGNGGSWQFQDGYTNTAAQITQTRGTLDTNGQTISNWVSRLIIPILEL
jgi:hypothetical protein